MPGDDDREWKSVRLLTFWFSDRINPRSATAATPLAAYYIINDSIYQAPDLYSVLATRLVSTHNPPRTSPFQNPVPSTEPSSPLSHPMSQNFPALNYSNRQSTALNLPCQHNAEQDPRSIRVAAITDALSFPIPLLQPKRTARTPRMPPTRLKKTTKTRHKKQQEVKEKARTRTRRWTSKTFLTHRRLQAGLKLRERALIESSQHAGAKTWVVFRLPVYLYCSFTQLYPRNGLRFCHLSTTVQAATGSSTGRFSDENGRGCHAECVSVQNAVYIGC